jgi:imidazolonepropionase-like amidohydrolase
MAYMAAFRSVSRAARALLVAGALSTIGAYAQDPAPAPDDGDEGQDPPPGEEPPQPAPDAGDEGQGDGEPEKEKEPEKKSSKKKKGDDEPPQEPIEPPKLPEPELLIRARRLIVAPGVEREGVAILVQDGRIAAIGAGLEAPEGVRAIEGEVVCAGFLDPWSTLGIEAPSAEDLNTSASTRTADAVDAWLNEHLRRDALGAGVVAVRTQAGERALFGGVGSVILTRPVSGASEGVLLADACVNAAIGVRGEGPFDRVGQADRIASTIESGRRYLESKIEHRYDLEEWQKKIAEEQEKLEKDFKKAQKDREKEEADAKEKGKEFKEKTYKEDKKPSAPSFDPDDEVMARVADGELPLVVEAHRFEELRALLEVTRPFDRLRLIVAGATEAAPLASELAERGVAVIVYPQPVGRAPGGEWARASLDLAANLHAAGVEVLLGSGGASTARDLPLLAELAIAHGLPREAAFEALTIGAARALDVAGELGSVEPGKRAELLVLDGDPLRSTTRVQYVISGGKVGHEPR